MLWTAQLTGAIYLQVHQRADSLRAQISALEKICHVYNGVQRTLLPIEKPLVQAKLDALDAALQGGLAVSHPAHQLSTS